MRFLDAQPFYDAHSDLVQYGIKLNDEDSTFNAKLSHIIKKHPFAQRLLIADGNGATTSFFDLLKQLDSAEDIEKNIEVFNALSSALTYRLRIKNTTAIETRNDVNGLNPFMYKIQKEKAQELKLLPENTSVSS